MTVAYWEVTMPVIGLLINVLVQICVLRLFPWIGLLKSIVVGFAAGVCGVLILELYIFIAFLESMPVLLSFLMVNLVIYTFLGYCYFHFLNLGETARRVRILREIDESEEGLTMDEVLEKYNAKEIVHKRLKRLLKNSQIIEKNGRYYIGNPAVLIMARVLLLLKIILFGEGLKISGEKTEKA